MSVPEEPRGDRLTEAHVLLTAAVEQLVSGEDWARMLAFGARFHQYSFNNLCLAAAQCMARGIEPQQFAGYRTWQALGRQVRRGERGLAILAPIVRRVRVDEPPEGSAPPSPAKEKDESPSAHARQVLAGFKAVAVFDVSQTDGPPLPVVGPELLAGDAPAALFEGLAHEVERAGFQLLRADCSPANGSTDFLARTVTVRPDCSSAQATKTLAHELGHVLLHDEERFRVARGVDCRGVAEVEAESVAFLVCQSAGLTTDDYSFPYIARWARGDASLLRTTADRSLGAARRLTAALGLTEKPNDQATEAVLARARPDRAHHTRRASPPVAPTRNAGLGR